MVEQFLSFFLSLFLRIDTLLNKFDWQVFLYVSVCEFGYISCRKDVIESERASEQKGKFTTTTKKKVTWLVPRRRAADVRSIYRGRRRRQWFKNRPFLFSLKNVFRSPFLLCCPPFFFFASSFHFIDLLFLLLFVV